MEIDKYKKLELKLKELKKPELTAKQKSGIKSEILSSIKTENNFEYYPSLQKVKNLISKLSADVKPDSVFRARLAETINSFTKNHKSAFVWHIRKIFASALVVLITFMVATVYISDIPVIKAARQTIITNLSGQVEVVRQSESIDAYSNMYLKQGDILITGSNGTAIVRYIDESVSRLSPNSELKIKKLYQDENKRSETKVKIEIKKGRVWNQVINMVGNDSSFEVETEEATANASEKASFEVKAEQPFRTEISVYDNKVEVSTKDEKQTILEGYTIDANKLYPQIDRTALYTQEDKEWVYENIAKDREYKNEVMQEIKKETKSEAGYTSESPLYSAKKFNESTKLFLTGDAEENAKLKIDIALKRLNEATVYINEEKLPEAEDLIKEFRSIVNELKNSVNDSEEVKDYFENSFSEKSKDFIVVLPDDPLYKIKEELRDAKRSLAFNDKEKRTIELMEAEEKLIEIKELIKENKKDIAQEKLIEIQEAVVGISFDDSEKDEEFIEEYINTLNSAKVLLEVAEVGDDPEMVELAEFTHALIEDDINDSINEKQKEIKNDVIDTHVVEQQDTLIEVTEDPVITDL